MAKEDHNHPRIWENWDIIRSAHEDTWDNYEPTFAGFDRSLIGRVASDISVLKNNVPGSATIKQGEGHYWTFPKDALSAPRSPATSRLSFEAESREFGDLLSSNHLDAEFKARDLLERQDGTPDGTTIFVTLTTCDRPSLISSNFQREHPPSLKLYISKSSSNQKPDQKANDFTISVNAGGYGAQQLEASNDVFFAVIAPKNASFAGIYSYELTASIDALYAAYNQSDIDQSYAGTNFFYADSDSNSALLVANETTTDSSLYQQWMTSPPPYSIFVHSADDPAILGVESSLCGLKRHAQIKGNLINGQSSSNVETGMNDAPGGHPKQQFYVSGLNASSEYRAYLAVDHNATSLSTGVIQGGGTVSNFLSFRTKSDHNCALLFNLTFCTSVSYAVPSNPQDPSTQNHTSLAALYDTQAQDLYRNFSYSLQQIPCQTTITAQYSLARNCTDCAAAYKNWLCAVIIPRCDDFSSPSPWLQSRSVAQKFYNGSDPPTAAIDPAFSAANKSITSMNSSRNGMIDDLIAPGPWKEVLPCTDLCYGLVQSCPAALGFACPLEGKGLEQSYGTQSKGIRKRTCNYPGEPWFHSRAAGIRRRKGTVLAAGMVTIIFLALDSSLF